MSDTNESFDSDQEYADIDESGSDTSMDEGDLSSESEDDGDESESDADGHGWKKVKLSLPLVQPQPRFTYVGNAAVNFVPDPDDSLLQYFNAIFDDELVDSIVTETNRYASQCLGEASQSSANGRQRWHPTNSNELRVFLAIIILQGIVKKPELELYWSKNLLLSTPFFRQAMSYRRFCKIKQYLHFSNNEDFDPESHPNPKLYKVLPVYESLVNKFKTLYTPERDVSIDESPMLYKGRLGWIHYIPLKRARFGIKTYMLCESDSGYVWNFVIYTGKGTQFDVEYDNLPVSSRVVMTLMKPLLDKGYCVTVDNYYTSPQLADLLVQHQTDIYGTVKPTRKEMPEDLRKAKLKKGEVSAYERGKVTVLRWKDKKDVNLLSTIHNAEIVNVEKRGVVKSKPKLVLEYNNTMGGVDKVDQHLTDYPVPRKRGKKYYKKIFPPA